MTTRFVITEFFRTPHEQSGSILVWYHKNSFVVKREIILGDNNYFCDRFYNKNGERHRDNGEPAVIESNGSLMFYFNGKKHRSHFEPAIIHPNGVKEYWVYGELRRTTIEFENEPMKMIIPPIRLSHI